jgi:hypothetical protein
MRKQIAIRLHVEVREDRSVTLPDEVPAGPTEIIVLVDEPATGPRVAKSLLGLFADEPDVVAEAMAYVRCQRQSGRFVLRAQ